MPLLLSRFVALLLSLLTTALLSAQAVTAFVDRPLQDYAPGETIVFKVRSESLRGELNYRIRYGARSPILAEGRIQYTGGVVEVPYTPQADACFLNFEANLAGNGTAVTVTVGRDQVGPFFDEPADFDAFWAGQKAALAAVPPDVQRWKIAENELSTTYQFSAAQVDGRRVYGYVVVPKGVGPFPASLRLPPFGQGANTAQPDTEAAEKANLIAATITIHNAPANQEDPNAYKPEDLRSRETIYYRYAILAAIRTIDVIAQEAQWDRRNLLVYGDSQGGGLSMLVAGIDGRPSHLVQSVAALSRHGAELLDRPAGFPYYVETAEALYSDTPDDIERVRIAVSYYDAVYAARRFSGPSMHFVNYLDPTCPPATHYAAFNAMRGPKIVLHSLDLYHSNAPEFTEDLHDFTRAYIPAASTPPFPFGTRRKGYFVDAGASLIAIAGTRVQLRPFATYDLRAPEADWTYTWSKVSGPGDVTFENGQSLNAGATFSAPGEYRLRLQMIDPYPEQPRKYWLLSDDVVVNVDPVDTTSDLRDLPPGLRDVQLSPNPASTQLRVSADLLATAPVSVSLTDVLGRTVQLATELPSAGKLDALLPVADFPRGAYVLTLHLEGYAPVSRAVQLQ